MTLGKTSSCFNVEMTPTSSLERTEREREREKQRVWRGGDKQRYIATIITTMFCNNHSSNNNNGQSNNDPWEPAKCQSTETLGKVSG